MGQFERSLSVRAPFLWRHSMRDSEAERSAVGTYIVAEVVPVQIAEKVERD